MCQDLSARTKESSYKERRADALALEADRKDVISCESCGKEQISCDPQMSEWENLHEVILMRLYVNS